MEEVPAQQQEHRQPGISFISEAAQTGWRENQNGGMYRHGLRYDDSRRVSCIRAVQVNRLTVREAATKFGVSPSYVSKVNSVYLAELSLFHSSPVSKVANNARIPPELLEVLAAIVKANPISWLKQYATSLMEILPPEPNQTHISESVVCRALQRLKITRKQVTTVATEKFTPANMKYYGEYLAAVTPLPNSRLFFFDETHFNRLGTFTPLSMSCLWSSFSESASLCLTFCESHCIGLVTVNVSCSYGFNCNPPVSQLCRECLILVINHLHC